MRFVILMTLLFCWLGNSAQDKGASPPNVLFIFVDDLRPELGCYGNGVIKTPNIDKLAEEGSLFSKHYVQVPTCGASRYTLLTGMLPKSKDQLSNEVIRNYISNEPKNNIPESFIDQLKRKGYFTVGIGKISHYIDGLYGYSDSNENAEVELPHSWDRKLFNPGKWKDGWDAFFAYADGSSRITKNKLVKPYEMAKVDDQGYPDGLTANLALEQLDELALSKEPFFLGVGFFKPHLPFNAPKKYWDLYRRSDIPLTPSKDIPVGVDLSSLHNSSEFNRYELGEEKPNLKKPASKAYARKITHAYYAAVSYIDAQIGKLLDKLKAKGLNDNTIVILWGDHGWQLGDHRVWGKHTLFEKALRSPLIIKDPRIVGQRREITEIVSSVDIYPTLMELCSIKMPYKTSGRSMVKLLDLNQQHSTWKQVSYSYFNQGISVRVPGYRYTKYYREQKPVIELYNHKTDPHENVNVAAENPKIVEELDVILEKGNTGLYKKDQS